MQILAKLLLAALIDGSVDHERVLYNPRAYDYAVLCQAHYHGGRFGAVVHALAYAECVIDATARGYE